jgi:hypothetical protein
MNTGPSSLKRPPEKNVTVNSSTEISGVLCYSFFNWEPFKIIKCNLTKLPILEIRDAAD